MYGIKEGNAGLNQSKNATILYMDFSLKSCLNLEIMYSRDITLRIFASSLTYYIDITLLSTSSMAVLSSILGTVHCFPS